jgi:hypothetical protein
MRWVAALAVGSLAAIALAALLFVQNNVDDWRSNRASLLAQIASIERDAANPNRDRGLASAHELMELTNGAALERVGLSAVVLALAIAALIPSWRCAARSFSRVRLVLLAAVGAVIPVAVGWLTLMMLGAGAIRG